MDNIYCVKSVFKDSTAIATDIVTRCLTTECKLCLGSYYNKVLDHRFICVCKCHDERSKYIAKPIWGEEH